MNNSISSDEKVMAALAHGSAILAFIGPLVPVIIWSTQRKKSTFVAFHALQAMGYQALTYWLWMAATLLILPLIFILIPISAVIIGDSSNAGMVPFIIQPLIFLFVFGLMGLFFLIGVVGAIFCLTGRDFRYPVMGKWLEKYLSYNADVDSLLDETNEDNWVAGICHATAILQLWGAITPIVVWFSQRERSARLNFQSMQAFLYQLTAFAAYMLGMFVYMMFFFGIFFTIIVGGTMANNQELQGIPLFVMGGFFIVMMLFWLVILILMPIYYLLAGVASYRLIRGHHFRYPILGRLLEKRMELTQGEETAS